MYFRLLVNLIKSDVKTALRMTCFTPRTTRVKLSLHLDLKALKQIKGIDLDLCIQFEIRSG